MTPSKSPKKSNGSPARRRLGLWLERVLLAAGIIGLGIWAGSKVIPPLWQAWENRQFDLAKQNRPQAPKSARPAPPKNGELLGRLSIPRLEISSMVREGDDETTLSVALGHIPSTALPGQAAGPGQAGNVGVAGHRDTLFRALRKIRKDDLIRFETLSGTHVYAVDSTRIVKPDDVAVLKPQAMPTLTLVTCYPFYYVGAAPDRFIVSAHEVPPEVLNASVQAQPAPAAQGVPGQVKKAALQPVDFHSAPAHTPTATRPADFEIRKGSSREVAPGISLGITDIDPRSGSVYGWIFLAREQRTILMTNHRIRKPVMFLQGGRERELRFSGISNDTARGSLTSE